MSTRKEQGAFALLAVAVSVLTGLVTLWTFTENVFAGEIKREIQAQLAPVLETQKILLASDIESRRLGISALEFKRDMCAGVESCWTIRDAQDLTRARAELAARELAYRNLER
jgi:hypothetical protein